MAGYVKLWTTLLDDAEFLGLTMAQRGAYVQLILECKRGRDDGMVSYRDQTALGSAWGCDRKTAGKTLGILAEKSLVEVITGTEKEASRAIRGKSQGKVRDNSQNNSIEVYSGVITISLPNYKQWQEMTVDKLKAKHRKNPGKIPSLRPDQSRPEQSRAELKDKELSGKPEKDKTYNLKWEYINKRFEQIMGFKGNAKVVGMLLSWGQDIGQTVAAINKSKAWTTEAKFIGQIRRNLKSRGLWSDDDWILIKSENVRFDSWLGQKCGTSIGQILKNF